MMQISIYVRVKEILFLRKCLFFISYFQISHISHHFPIDNQNKCLYNNLINTNKRSVRKRSAMPFLYEDIFDTSKTVSGTPISVISAFNRQGMIKPLRVRLDSYEGQIEANIDKVLSSEKKYNNLYIFQCLITLNNIQQQYKIIYDSQSNVWKVNKKW